MYLLFVFSQSQRLLAFVGNNSGTSAAAGSQFGCLFLAIWLEEKRPTKFGGPTASHAEKWTDSNAAVDQVQHDWMMRMMWWDHFSCVAYNIVWNSCETHVFNSTQTQIALKVCFNKTSKQKVRSEYYVMLLLFSLWFWLTEWMNGGRREKWKVLSKKKRLAINCKLNMGEIIFNTLFPLLHFSWAWDTSECERWLISYSCGCSWRLEWSTNLFSLPSPILLSLFSSTAAAAVKIKSSKQTVTCLPSSSESSAEQSIYCRCFFSWLVYYNFITKLAAKLVLVLRLLSERPGFVCCWLAPKFPTIITQIYRSINPSIQPFIHPSSILFQNAASKSEQQNGENLVWMNNLWKMNKNLGDRKLGDEQKVSRLELGGCGNWQ